MSISKRKFYRTIVQVEILSETPYSSTDLEKINDDITNGAQVGIVNVIADSEEISPKTCADKLNAFGSEPDFFCLDVHGHDTEDAEDFEEDDEEDHTIRKLKKD